MARPYFRVNGLSVPAQKAFDAVGNSLYSLREGEIQSQIDLLETRLQAEDLTVRERKTLLGKLRATKVSLLVVSYRGMSAAQLHVTIGRLPRDSEESRVARWVQGNPAGDVDTRVKGPRSTFPTGRRMLDA
jgi:hypothetical protein